MSAEYAILFAYTGARRYAVITCDMAKRNHLVKFFAVFLATTWNFNVTFNIVHCFFIHTYASRSNAAVSLWKVSNRTSAAKKLHHIALKRRKKYRIFGQCNIRFSNYYEYSNCPSPAFTD